MAITNTSISAPFENVSSNIQFYTVFAKSPGAYSDPENATCVNILMTGNYTDESQKNFEILLQSIGLRAMPVMMNKPCPYEKLQTMGAPNIFGEGFIWKFSVEMPYVFENFTGKGTPGPVGLLIDELNGVVLHNGTILRTKGQGTNIEFVRRELL